MRNLNLTSRLLAAILSLYSVTAVAQDRPLQIIDDAIQAAELVEAFGEILDAAEEGTISLFNYAQMNQHYSGVLSGENVDPGTGILLDATVLEVTSSGRKFAMAPLVVGAGTSAEQVGLRATLGQRSVEHETLAADLNWLSEYDEVASLPDDFFVSDSSRLYWLYRRNDGAFTIHLIEDGKTFWANARQERRRILIQSSVIRSLPEIEAIRARSEAYSDVASLYSDRINNSEVSGQIFSLRTARTESAESLADALSKLGEAKRIQESLKSLQFFQDALSVASIANNAATSAANSAQMEQIESEVSALKDSMADMGEAVSNLQAQIDYFGTAQERISTELNSLESTLNQIWVDYLGIGPEALPDPQPVLQYP